MRGLEPPRGCPHGDLNAARLPIPPHPRAAGNGSGVAGRARAGIRRRKLRSFRGGHGWSGPKRLAREVTAVEQIHALWSVYESGGPLATLEHLPEDCEWVPSSDLPPAGTIRGQAEIRAYLERLTHDGVRMEPAVHTYEQLGDDAVLVGGRMRVVAKAALSDSPLYWVCRLRDAKVVRIESYPCRREALSAASS
jgi:ketosteroid isomerase-like protein